MSIAAGRLKHRVQIQEFAYIGQNPETGEEIRDWTTIDTVWAAVEPLSARELIAAQAVQSKVTGRIVIRYRDALAADMRIVHRGMIYNTAGFLPDKDSGLEYITIPVSEGVSVTGQ